MQEFTQADSVSQQSENSIKPQCLSFEEAKSSARDVKSD